MIEWISRGRRGSLIKFRSNPYGGKGILEEVLQTAVSQFLCQCIGRHEIIYHPAQHGTRGILTEQDLAWH